MQKSISRCYCGKGGQYQQEATAAASKTCSAIERAEDHLLSILNGMLAVMHGLYQVTPEACLQRAEKAQRAAQPMSEEHRCAAASIGTCSLQPCKITSCNICTHTAGSMLQLTPVPDG